ncbi:unnamed protein product [Rotaria sp. Silwood2]|nr:unnamed protein product [Rotaria sp. Silwood2]CAF2665952.1 unnamed protein product [Rotaria sp. Silwood2]CAF3192722.1 unnamed protein product [Rotaria sp. Silwood2]CAF3928165.1 unnamed protein product [Rotaria sp. Silwood2]CAF4009336.1 unnamed protein product [Rotaria sp. Silwood2]
MSNLWHQLRVCLINEEDARAYNTCLGRLGIRAQDDNDKDLKYWWLSFWTTVGMKLPQVAVDHVEQFLATTIDQKDMNFLVILPVKQIIRQAVIAASDAISDELQIEMKRLLPVFLSYQWGTQVAVTILKGHLEEAGYACWMDTRQMGGGDKRFAKIDAGIRGAKVVLCCTTEVYAQSDNCSREVHLCVSTGKPLIPL